MENIALIGIDLGKNSFHIHCQDHRGKAVYRKKFTRPKLISPQFVRPFVKSNKNDFVDAEAIC
ncbi:IS110 family transposase, partial [Shigella flexneri]|nr:IS110 family transposase [Shigella flexneri]